MKKNLKSVDLHLIGNLALSVIVLIMGIIIMIFKAFGLTDIILYVSVLFYIYAFFSVIAYFIKRREGDYELLLLSLINIVVATYMFMFQEDSLPMILGSAMTIYTILIISNRGYKVLQLKSQDNYMWIIKFIMTFLIAFIGVLTTINLFNETTVQTMMMGYYFISTGVLLTIESTLELFMTDRAFNNIISKLIDEEETPLEEIIETKVDESISLGKVESSNISEKKKASGRPKKEVATKETKNIKPKKIESDTPKKVVKSTKLTKVEVTTKKETNKTVKDANKQSEPIKENKEIKKAGRPKKEAAVKESKKREVIVVENKKKAGRPKKEVATKVTKETKKVETKPAKTEKKTEPKKASASKQKATKKSTKENKTVTKKPGRPKKTTSK